MNIKKWLTKTMLGLVILSLLSTSLGGAWITTAYAAESGEAGAAGDDKAVVGGLLALGLLAMLAGGKDDHKSNAGNTATAPETTTAPAAAPVASPSGTAEQPQTNITGLTADESKAFALLNADRAANGLPALKVNMSLVRLAENYAQDMINRNYFSHYNPEGQSPFERMQQAGISYQAAGENLAINSSVAAAEKAFMNSSGHRANILNTNYTEVGIGVRKNAAGSVYVVQEFIKN